MDIARSYRSRTCGRVCGLLAGLSMLAVGGWASAQENGGGGGKVTVLAVERVSLDKVLVDPKDQPLAKALAMIPRRVRELPHEFPEFPPEVASVANLVLSTLSRPVSVVVSYDGTNEEQQAFGYGLVISVESSGQQDAEQMHAQIGGLMAAGPQVPTQPSEQWPSMKELETPTGLLRFGPRQAKRGWRYELIYGNVTDPDAGLDVLPEVEKGLEPVVRGRLDLEGLTPILSLAQAFTAGDPRSGQVFERLEAAGLFGEDALKASFQIGHTKDESVSMIVMHGAKRFAEAWNTSATPLTKAELAAIPADATWASIGKADLSWIDGLIEEVAAVQPEVEEGLGMFTQQTGVDLRADVLRTLGGTMGLYISDSTGGGSLGSAVALIGFKDRERLLGAHAKLVAFANAAAEQAPPPAGGGHIRITSWKDGEVELFSLRFPGLPVPIELTWAATEKWLIAGLTPQAVVAAARQANGKGDGGLPSNASFAAQFQGREAISVSFLDTAWLTRTGFPIVSMLGSGLSNAVRSPSDPEREPGLIVPTFKELTKGARATVQYTYWRGDDLVTETHSDRSFLVNATTMAGLIAKIAPLVAIPAAAGAARRGELGMIEPAESWALAAALTAPAPMIVKERVIEALAAGWLAR